MNELCVAVAITNAATCCMSDVTDGRSYLCTQQKIQFNSQLIDVNSDDHRHENKKKHLQSFFFWVQFHSCTQSNGFHSMHIKTAQFKWFKTMVKFIAFHMNVWHSKVIIYCDSISKTNSPSKAIRDWTQKLAQKHRRRNWITTHP